MSEPLRILIVDDNEMMVKTLQDIFRIKGYRAEAAYSGPEALKKVEANHYDCILSDIKMPDINGVELYRAIKAKDPLLPVVLMTAYSTDKLIEEGLKEGVVAVLTKPLNIEMILNFLAFLHREQSIVIVDDDAEFCRTLSDILQNKNFTVLQITDPRNVPAKLEFPGQIVLLDMKLQGSSGLDVLREIRKQYPYMPVILVTGYREEVESALEDALEMNAYTYLYKPLKIKKLLQVLSNIHHQELGRVLGRPTRKP
jgi:DNA-binding NtrC family response regulator